jgi:hypothetical protein
VIPTIVANACLSKPPNNTKNVRPQQKREDEKTRRREDEKKRRREEEKTRKTEKSRTKTGVGWIRDSSLVEAK